MKQGKCVVQRSRPCKLRRLTKRSGYHMACRCNTLSMYKEPLPERLLRAAGQQGRVRCNRPIYIGASTTSLPAAKSSLTHNHLYQESICQVKFTTCTCSFCRATYSLPLGRLLRAAGQHTHFTAVARHKQHSGAGSWGKKVQARLVEQFNKRFLLTQWICPRSSSPWISDANHVIVVCKKQYIISYELSAAKSHAHKGVTIRSTQWENSITLEDSQEKVPVNSS